MRARTIPAVFMRGGTSKGLVFKGADLPADQARWDALFCAAMGSPDASGRQLDGMGGGLSSVSKVCVVSRPSRADADVDYTFAQVSIRDARIDMSGNCGNMSSAVGPFAVDEGLIAAADGPVTIRIHNTNTQKIIHSTFEVRDGRAVEHGDFAIPGVAGTAAPIRLEFLEPGGAITGKLLPTGDVVEELDVPGVGRIDVSMIDAGNACVFVRAESLGLTGTETPEQIEHDARLMEALLAIRARASVAMGITPDMAAAQSKITTPSIGIVCRTERLDLAERRDLRGRRGEPRGAHDLQQPAASRTAAHGIAVYRGRRRHSGHAGAHGRAVLRPGAAAARHAVGRAHRSGRGAQGPRRLVRAGG